MKQKTPVQKSEHLFGKMDTAKNKKSQVTIYVILGVVIIIAVGLFFLFRGKVEQNKIEIGQITTKPLPQELNPVKLYMDSYIEQKTKDAVKISLAHGGYIDYQKLTANKFSPTEANSIELFPDSQDKIPYWHYMSSRNTCGNDCAFSTEMPPLCKQGRNCLTNGRNSIEEQMENYLTAQLKSLDLNQIQSGDILEVKSLGEPKVKATIRDNDVVIYATYPLSIKTTSNSHKIEQFQIIQETSLTELYGQAKKIAEYESSNCFIGKYINDVHVPVYFWSGDDSKERDLPPTSEIKLMDTNYKIFVVEDVKKRVKEEISRGVSDIGIENTKNVRYPQLDCNDDKNKLACGLHYQRLFQPFDSPQDIDARLTYNPALYDIYFDIQPRDGAVLKPKSLQSPVPMLSGITQTKIYEFSYDYSFPVMIELRKPKINGDETFRFAVESNVRGNTCYSKPIPIINSISLSADLSCDEDFKDNKVEITVLDEITKNPVEGAEVSYFAGYGICPGVLTDKDGKVVLGYPDSSDIVFTIDKQKYLTKNFRTAQSQASLQAGQQTQPNQLSGFATLDEPAGAESSSEKTTQEISPIIDKDIKKSVEFRLISANLLEEIANPYEINNLRENNYEIADKDYSVIMTLNRAADDSTDEYTTTIYLDKGESSVENLEIPSGKYEITGQLILNKNIIIPEEKNRLCIDKETQEAVGGVTGGVAGGVAAGQVLGAAAGSVVPIVGNIVVGAIGGYIGGKVGSFVGGLINECHKEPINSDCSYPGESDDDFKKGDCYKWGYKCSGSCEVDEDLSTDAIDLGSSFPIGGVTLTDVEITSNDLSKEKIIFYLVKSDIPTRVYHLEEIGKYDELSQKNRDALLPKFD